MLPPVIWKPTTKFGYPYKGDRGRMGQPVRVFVNHRIVGTLASADWVFDPANSRVASAHFAIGFINGRLEIHQYVDLTDAAWTNGDVREPTAKVVLANPGINPNLYSVTIEHEDGGSAGRGVVKPEVWAASIELQRLLTSGNPASIRAAGIRVRSDTTVAQMAKVPKTVDGFIDHHQIAGPNKPYCFRRWLDDAGFVEGSPSRRDQLLTALNPKPDVALPYFKPATGVARAGAIVRDLPDGSEVTRLAGGPIILLAEVPAGAPKWLLAFLGARSTDVSGVNLGTTVPDRLGWVARSDVTFDKSPINLEFVQRVGKAVYTDEPIDAEEAVKAATDSLNQRISTIKKKVATLAADVAND